MGRSYIPCNLTGHTMRTVHLCMSPAWRKFYTSSTSSSSARSVLSFCLRSSLKGQEHTELDTLVTATGSVRVQRISWQPFALHSFCIQQPASLGRIPVFTAEAIRFHYRGGLSLAVTVSKPWVNLRGDENGLLHFVALLQVLQLKLPWPL